MKTLLVGLGNPILGDDGVGWEIIREVEQKRPGVESLCVAVGGIGLMEQLVGYDRVILVDSLDSGLAPPGTVHSFLLSEMPNRTSGHTASAHDTSLQNALEVGRLLGAHLPDQVMIVAVESQEVYEFSETFSLAVANAIPIAVHKVLELLNQNCKEG